MAAGSLLASPPPALPVPAARAALPLRIVRPDEAATCDGFSAVNVVVAHDSVQPVEDGERDGGIALGTSRASGELRQPGHRSRAAHRKASRENNARGGFSECGQRLHFISLDGAAGLPEQSRAGR